MNNDEKLEQIWNDFLKDKEITGDVDPILQKKLVNHYYPLVVKVAHRLYKKLKDVQKGDLESMGIDGLYDAIRKYDPSKLTKFETYAMHRIRGSIYDEIRKSDWVPRLVRSNTKKLEKIKNIAESEEGRKLTEVEIYNKIGLTEKDFNKFIKSTSPKTIYSVNDKSSDSEENTDTFNINFIKDKSESPLNKIMKQEFFSKLVGSSCTELERKIIKYYYYDNLSMKEISEKIDLSESRISQMHSSILERLKNKVSRNPNFFSDVMDVLERV